MKLHEIVIDIEVDENDGKEIEEEYQLQPLNLGNDFYIENREEDGYINVTNLCKAGNKKFSHWNLLDKTNAFLRVLSTKQVQDQINALGSIPMLQLILLNGFHPNLM